MGEVSSMSFTKKELMDMALDLRAVSIDIKYRYRVPDPIMDKLNNVEKKLLERAK